ncbi:MAG: pantetheine-phosphate adenylyltransferase [Spirochaetaceae bacterium]|nr:pantetheine-phosphate adenylyltransferase [Spirochaetaceae bacterium]
MKVVFAGSFDPPTMGHLDVIERSANLFDEVHVVIAHNASKRGFFPVDVRKRLLEETIAAKGLKNVQTAICKGPIVDYAKANGCRALIRCVRSMADLPGEQLMASMNLRLSPSMETLLFVARREYVDISSSAVRELVAMGRLPAGVVPDAVQKELENRFGPLLQVNEML